MIAIAEIGREGNENGPGGTTGAVSGAGSGTERARATSQSTATNVPRNPRSWRKRLKATSTRATARRLKRMTVSPAVVSSDFETSVIVVVRWSANHRSTVLSNEVAVSAPARIAASTTPRRMTPETIHTQRIQPCSRGSGGGSPEGRRTVMRPAASPRVPAPMTVARGVPWQVLR